MAITTLYFGVSDNGAADGSSWANRAALFTGGAWSTLITGFNFTSGGNSLRCIVEAGTHTITAGLGTASFTSGTPTVADPLYFVAANADGTGIWEPPDPDWCSAMPAWDDSGMPVFASTTNINMVNVSTNVYLYGIKFTSSGATSQPTTGTANYNWVIVENSTNNVNAGGISISQNNNVQCVVIRMTGTAYNYGFNRGLNAILQANIRIEGNISATSGNRGGIYNNNNESWGLAKCVSINHVGGGFVSGSTGTAATLRAVNCIAYGNSGPGFANPSVTGTGNQTLERCIAVNNGTYGVNTTTSAPMLITGCRFRNNSTADINGTGDHPVDLYNDTSAGNDSDEFVNVSGAVSTWDLRIKNTSSKWGKGYGVADQPASGGGGLLIHPGMTGGISG